MHPPLLLFFVHPFNQNGSRASPNRQAQVGSSSLHKERKRRVEDVFEKLNDENAQQPRQPKSRKTRNSSKSIVGHADAQQDPCRSTRSKAQRETPMIKAPKTISFVHPVELERVEIVNQDAEEDLSSGALPSSDTREFGVDRVKTELSTQDDERLSANIPAALETALSRVMLTVESNDPDLQERCLRLEACIETPKVVIKGIKKRRPANNLSSNLERDASVRSNCPLPPPRRSSGAATHAGSMPMFVGEMRGCALTQRPSRAIDAC